MERILLKVKGSPIVAVVRNIPDDQVLYVVETLLKGGVSNIEIAFGKYNTPKAIEDTKKQFSDDVTVGAGTVLTTEEVDIAINSGAQFIFSPNFNEEVVKRTVEKNVISIPGCFTPTEIYNAHQCGAHVVKVFPA